MIERKIPNGTRVKMKNLKELYRRRMPVRYGISSDMFCMSCLLGTITASDESESGENYSVENYSVKFDNGRTSSTWSISKDMFDVIVPFKSFNDLMKK